MAESEFSALGVAVDPAAASTPNAASFSDLGFCFLVHHTMTNTQVQLMKNNINQVLSDLNTR